MVAGVNVHDASTVEVSAGWSEEFGGLAKGKGMLRVQPSVVLSLSLSLVSDNLL